MQLKGIAAPARAFSHSHHYSRLSRFFSIGRMGRTPVEQAIRIALDVARVWLDPLHSRTMPSRLPGMNSLGGWLARNAPLV